MSPREQPERVQAALRSDREPLAMTVERLDASLRGRVGRYLLLAALVGGGGFTAHKTGFAEMLLARAPDVPATAADPRVDVLAKRSANTERLVRWLVRQEIRRQAREGGPIAEPPEDVE